jgi:tRNA G10  N-methylase Trm11
MIICILGRQPALGLAELESLYGADNVRPVGAGAALVDADVDFSRLGGTIKAGTGLTTVSGTNPQKALLWLQKNLASQVADHEGKLKLGLSLYDLTMPVNKLNANALSLKKALRQAGHSVRVVPNTDLALSSAQTHHNNLTDERGCEILIVRDGDSMLVARATYVQNIDAYRRRDQERPMRDAYVGMLPPKLAQIIINLATGTPEGKERDSTSGPITLLDPFCGTGVVLQEAALMGYAVYGTDLSEKMVRYSRDNMVWLKDTHRVETDVYYEVGDATEHRWRQPIDIVACEGYLGHPFATTPSKEALMETVQTTNVIMRKFLQNIARQLKPGARLCIAAPAWQFRGRFTRLPILDDLENLGYNRIDFVHANREDLIYHREGQVTGRELVVLTKE